MQFRRLSRVTRPCFVCWCLSVMILSAMTIGTVRSSAPSHKSSSSSSSSSSKETVATTTDPPLPPQSHRNHHRHQSYQHKVHHQHQKDSLGRTVEDSTESSSDSPLMMSSVMVDSQKVPVRTAASAGRTNKLQRQEQKQQPKEQQQPSGSDTVAAGDGTVAYERSYIASNCSRCRMLEETINLTKEAIKQQILSKLGLKQPPNITGRALPRIPPLNHLLDMYGMQSDAPGLQAFKPGPVFEEAEDDYHAKTEKVISFSQEPPKSWSLPSNMEVQYFKFSHSVMVNKVIRANLWVYLTPSKAVQDAGTLVHVYKVSRTESSGGTVMTHVLSSKVHDLKPRRGGWVAVDIRKLAFEWFRHPYSNLGIVVQAFDQEGMQLVANGHQSESDASLIPFVEVYTMDESKRRTKRMIGLNCEENSHEVRCCRYPLTVDFEEFGWDWIIAPKKYEANYCSGECPFVFLQKYPHTHLVQHANPSGSAGPCCAPRKMSPISMLYFDNEYNIIYGLLPGMVVDRCSCS